MTFLPSFRVSSFSRRIALRSGTALAISAAIMVSGCTDAPRTPKPLPIAPGAYGQTASPRIDGPIERNPAARGGIVSYGRASSLNSSEADNDRSTGDISLNFAETDIRSATDQILGSVLGVNYMVDPAVHGTVTMRTTRPLHRDQVLNVFRSALAGSGATLIYENGLYRVVSNGSAGGGGLGGNMPGGSNSGDDQNGTIIPLRYTSAESLVKALQPILRNNGHLVAAPGSNAVAISGDPATRASLIDMVQAFDTDVLSGQSYAMFPTESGSAQELAQALQAALATKKGQAFTDRIQVIAMPRAEAVMVIASNPRFIDNARRAFTTIETQRRRSVRRWNVYYLQNGRANDVAYLLQQAFTPDHVTATPSAKMNIPNSSFSNNSSSNSTSLGMGNTQQSSNTGNSLLGQGTTGNSTNDNSNSQNGSANSSQSDSLSNNPLLGGLGNNSSSNSNDNARIRIIPDLQNNAVLVYSTPEENDSITAMLRKVDIMPLQVRVDATVAEVTLNDNLQYGTQFFFKSGGVNGVLSNATQSLGTSSLVSSALSSSFPGFVLGGSASGGAPFVINALQAVTSVRVLSSPELMVVDNQPASLMVGDMVPYLTGSTTGVLTANSTVTNSINYQPTGVILQVTPHVSNGGLVTLDVSQQVSSVASSTTSTGSGSINSPTFSQRQVTSRVVIADGQTVGLAGLISDRSERSNQGIPWLKDIPILGLLGGTQDNTRTRTELLVLITPHVIHSQGEALSLTTDLRERLSHAALTPDDLNHTPATGSSDPQHRVLKYVGLHD
ncbi:type II secretion system secretin GspD [Neokomagataea anthophila]|uniref:Type II secretion system secretin GspD n=1 Tax=Neokomagataea anthophila TaxID=2826925 RepID=A0ABS5E9J8_9PROT|nr:type II secretion system secretin GspD [Neokomagataea anthophila]